MSDPTAPCSSQHAASKLGGALAIVGGVVYFSTLLAHGDLPDETTRTALNHIAAQPEWRFLKLALMAALACWVGAFAALARCIPQGVSGLLATWASTIAAIGMATVVVEYSIIGHALKEVADAWHANAHSRPLIAAETMLAISAGLFHSFVIWMLGVPFVLAGAALAANARCPRGFGWVGIVMGSGAVVAGATRFLGIPLLPYGLLYGGFVLPANIWLVVLGVLMWRGLCRDGHRSSIRLEGAGDWDQPKRTL